MLCTVRTWGTGKSFSPRVLMSEGLCEHLDALAAIIAAHLDQLAALDPEAAAEDEDTGLRGWARLKQTLLDAVA